MNIIKNLYFYIFAAVGLVFILIGAVQLLQLGLRAYVFTQADSYISYPRVETLDSDGKVQQPTEEEIQKYDEMQRTSQRQRQATSGIAFVLVGIPLFAFHYKKIRQDIAQKSQSTNN